MIERIRARAGGRTIVALLGSLTSDKGVPEFVDVIARADARRFFFVLAGEIFWQSFGPWESRLRRFAASPPENCFVHAEYLPDERALNDMIVASHVLYAVYPNQRDSSNTLTKAATFERPVVVSDRHLIGERVRSFRLGAAVPFGDAQRVVAALETLSRQPRSEFGYEDYRAAHSHEALSARFGELLAAWTAQAQAHPRSPSPTSV
jgi:hypothetical protein